MLRRNVLLGLLVVVLVTAGGCSPTSATATPVPPVATKVPVTATATPVPVSGTQNVTITVIAKNMAFDQKTITVPAGAHVTVVFKNEDTVPHNFAVYENPSAQTKIFQGKVINGGEEVTEEFDAPAAPGTYFFRCNVHPQIMTGEFITK